MFARILTEGFSDNSIFYKTDISYCQRSNNWQFIIYRLPLYSSSHILIHIQIFIDRRCISMIYKVFCSQLLGPGNPRAPKTILNCDISNSNFLRKFVQ